MFGNKKTGLESTYISAFKYEITLPEIFKHLSTFKAPGVERTHPELQLSETEIHISIKNNQNEVVNEMIVRERMNGTWVTIDQDNNMTIVKFPPKNNYETPKKIIEEITNNYHTVWYMADVNEHPLNKDFYEARKKEKQEKEEQVLYNQCRLQNTMVLKQILESDSIMPEQDNSFDLDKILSEKIISSTHRTIQSSNKIEKDSAEKGNTKFKVSADILNNTGEIFSTNEVLLDVKKPLTNKGDIIALKKYK